MPAFLASELPEVCRTRHHWVTLLRPPRKWFLILAAVVAGLALLSGSTVLWVLLVILAVGSAVLRYLTWRAELVILTRKRVIRVQGIPETTTSEASLRLDRVSGARLIETVPGKLLGYGTIDLEAPGDHPDVRHLVKIKDANEFYLRLRSVIFGEELPPDPDDEPTGPTGEYLAGTRPSDFVTEPLPDLGGRRPGRRRLQ